MLVMVNVDNAAGETVPYIIETLMSLGAESVHAIPAITKKGRPEFIFLVDTARENVEAIGDFMVSEVGTLGMRLFEEDEHLKFDYEMKKVRLASQDKGLSLALNVKVVQDSRGSIASARVEYGELRAAVDVLARAGVKVSLVALKEMIEAAILSGEDKAPQGLSIMLE
jgi:uncharacterized protein (DUF111 family)